MFNPTEILSSWSEFTLQPPSEHFINCLRGIGDALTPSGQPVYERAILIHLTTSIASRSYGPELYRALHVLAAAALTGTRIDRLILPEAPLTGAMIISCFKDGAQNPSLLVEEQLLRFVNEASGAEEMKISERQLPAAIAMIEFLIEALGFEVVYQAYQKFAVSADNAAIKSTSKLFSASLYRFLGEHLPSASGRQMAQLLSHYLTSSHQTLTQIHPEDVTDEIIFDFWCEYADDETVSFRLFATVAQAWITYRNAIELAASDAFNRHQSFDQMFEEEQHSPTFGRQDDHAHTPLDHAPYSSTLGEVVGQIYTPAQWLDDLVNEPCDKIKFFTKVEQDDIGLPLLTGKAFRRLVLTCLRVAVFSPLQNKIVQAKRGKSSFTQEALFDQISADGYAAVMDRWQKMKSVAGGLCDTVYFRLWEAKAPSAFGYFANKGSEEERSALAQITGDQVPSYDRLAVHGAQVDTIAASVFAALDTLPASHPLNARKSNMQETAHRFRRKGLVPNKSASDDTRIDWLDALAISGDRLHRIETFFGELDTMTQSRADELYAKIHRDKQIFGDKLISLYEV